MASIVVVDDDAKIRLWLEELFRESPHHVVSADDGLAAWRICDSAMPDLVITDVLMPNKEGLELIQELKLRKPETKVIALSGGGVVDATECLAYAGVLGADRVFQKPVSMTTLLCAVDELLAA